MSVQTETTEAVCERCEMELADDDTEVLITIESSDLGCFRNVEKTHFLCGQCYTDYLTFIHENKKNQSYRR